MSDVVPRSNIVENPEMCERFFKEALRVTNSLKYRFFSVFEQMTSEDVVMECFLKVLKYNISYDETKNCKFETFVRIIVTSQLTDELKKLSASKRSAVCISLDSEVPGAEGDDEVTTLYNVVGDTKSQYYFEYLETKRDLCEIEKELSDTCDELLNSLLDLSEEGYSLSDIALISEVDRVELRQRLQNIKRVYYNRCEGTSVQISDILYGDDELRERKKEDLMSIAYMIRDEITGVRLSDVVRLVLRDYSYQRISERLNMSIYDIQRFLSKYEAVRI